MTPSSSQISSNITAKVSSAHFFSVLEDRKGNFWFGSIGSGVFRYDEKTGFTNFTTKEGLAGNDVTCIYEDKTGKIWFGTESGISVYNGKPKTTGQAGFLKFTTKKGPSINEVNSIIEDKTGKFWFATRGATYVFDGQKLSTFSHDKKPFTNVRSIIEDKKGNIWLGGSDGLWRYDGNTFTNFTQKFVTYIIQDKNGNIWTGSEREKSQAWALFPYDGKSMSNQAWVLSRYDEKSLSNKKPEITEIKPSQGMISSILEADDGSIWFGTSDGVYRYDRKVITDFKEMWTQK